jgi:hypothetical protein
VKPTDTNLRLLETKEPFSVDRAISEEKTVDEDAKHCCGVGVEVETPFVLLDSRSDTDVRLSQAGQDGPDVRIMATSETRGALAGFVGSGESVGVEVVATRHGHEGYQTESCTSIAG